ncbi:MAG: hypothetical protein RL226_1287 [Bacteroidota bacterium]|jgi:hypothetical protein
MKVIAVLTFLFSFFLSAHAQDEWVADLKGVAGSMIADLRITPTDSLCIQRPSSTTDVDGALLSSLGAVFVNQVAAVAKGAYINYPCSQPSGITVTPTVEIANNLIELKVQVESPSWYSKIYLPLPQNGIDSVDVFNQTAFRLPQLPAAATIVRMSGAEIPCILTKTDGIDLEFETTRKGKISQRSLHKSEVFAVRFNTGEWVLYGPDPFLGDDYSVDEMRTFIAGENDGRNHNITPTVIGGVVVGAAGPLVTNGALVFSVLPAVLYGVYPLVPYIKVQGKNISNPDYKHNEVYAAGYERTARPKKVVGAFKSAGAGMVAGIITYFILSK